MGRGNYLPPQEIREGYYEMVYVGMPDLENEFDLGFFELDLRSDIEDLLPQSFGPERDIWAWENKHVHVRLVADDVYYPLIVCPTGRFDDPRTNRGKGYVPYISSVLFNGLVEKGYRLSVRNGPHSSSDYERKDPMKTWNFHLTLAGSGETEEEAWRDAVEFADLGEVEYDYSDIEFEEEE